MNWFQSRPNKEVTRLEKRVRELETQLAAERAKAAVQQAEIDALAAVIARDRARVQAEMAEYNNRRATAEGMPHERTAKGLSSV